MLLFFVVDFPRHEGLPLVLDTGHAMPDCALLSFLRDRVLPAKMGDYFHSGPKNVVDGVTYRLCIAAQSFRKVPNNPCHLCLTTRDGNRYFSRSTVFSA